MHKICFLFTLLLVSANSSADIIKCDFTEPFYTITYSMAQQSLTIEGYSVPKEVIKRVSFQIKGPGDFELLDKNNKLLMKLELNYQGSDGMSDFIYPYKATYLPLRDANNYGIGGCTSNFLKEKG